jgi:hypothetical protein
MNDLLPSIPIGNGLQADVVVYTPMVLQKRLTSIRCNTAGNGYVK